MNGENPKKKIIKKKKIPKVSEHHLTEKISVRTDYDDPEIKKMMERIKEIDADIKEKILKLCEISGQSPKEVERFLGDKKNFTDEFMQKVEKSEYELMQKVHGKQAAQLMKIRKKKKELKESKTRLRKSLGRRKKWISMD